VEAVAHPQGRVVIFHIRPRPRDCLFSRRQILDAIRRTACSYDRGSPPGDFCGGHAGLVGGAQRPAAFRAGCGCPARTQTYFELRKLAYPTGQTGVLQRLEQDHVINRDGNGYSIKRLGALLLAKDLSHFLDVSRKAVRVVVYSGTSRGQH
jgi:hypothetical protein